MASQAVVDPQASRFRPNESQHDHGGNNHLQRAKCADVRGEEFLHK